MTLLEKLSYVGCKLVCGLYFVKVRSMLRHQFFCITALTMTVVFTSCAETEKKVSVGPSSQNTVAAKATNGNSKLQPTVVAPSASISTPQNIKQRSPAFTTVGSGRFLNRLNKNKKNVSENGEGYTLNFENIDVRDLIGSVFGSTLKLNYVIDPSIQGNVTIRTGSPIPKSKLLSHMEDVLLLHNISVLKENGLLKFVPSSNVPAGQITGAGSEGASTFGHNIEIIPIRYVDVEKMVELLKPYSKEGGILSFDWQRNFISISGSKLERDNLLEIIRIFDVDILSGMSFDLIPLVSTSPETIENELKAILGTGPDSLLTGVRFVSLPRLKSILIISKSPDRLDEARAWIKKLDFGTDPEKIQLYVYKVQNVEAAELAEILSGLLGNATTKEIKSDEKLLAPGLQAARITSEPEPPEPTLTQSDPTLNKQPSKGSSRKKGDITIEGKDSQVRIIANENTNSLFIRATPNQYNEIHAMLKLVDIVPLQVMIEATIAEVTLNDKLSYGIEWFFQSGNSNATFSTDASGAILSNFPGFSFFYGSNNVNAVINALDSVTDVNILSSPQLLVLDNHEAFLQIGDQVPVATQSVVDTTNPSAPVVNSIEFRDTGIVLKVTPRVNFNGLVNLDIQQEVSDVIPTTTSGIDSPTIQQRLINSSIVVQSGETIALGGLIRDKISDSETGIPVLSDIPILGSLFGSTEETHNRTELLILITPRVVKNQREAKDLTEELRRKIQAFSVIEIEN